MQLKTKQIKLFSKDFYLTFFPKKHNKAVCGVRGVLIKANKYFLIQRSSSDKIAPLQWEFPGGGIKIKEDVVSSLVREFKEETFLDVVPINKECFVWYDDIPLEATVPYAGFRRYAFYYKCNPLNTEVKLSYEHCAYNWFTKDQALKMNLTKSARDYLLSEPTIL